MILNIDIPPHPVIWDTAAEHDSKNSDIGQYIACISEMLILI